MDYKLPCVRIWHQCIVISSRSVDGQSRHTHTHRVTFYQLTAFSTFSNLWLWFPFVPTFIFIQNSTYLTKETKTKRSSVLFSFFLNLLVRVIYFFVCLASSEEEISLPRVEVVDRVGNEGGQNRAEESGGAGQPGNQRRPSRLTAFVAEMMQILRT